MASPTAVAGGSGAELPISIISASGYGSPEETPYGVLDISSRPVRHYDCIFVFVTIRRVLVVISSSCIVYSHLRSLGDGIQYCLSKNLHQLQVRLPVDTSLATYETYIKQAR